MVFVRRYYLCVNAFCERVNGPAHMNIEEMSECALTLLSGLDNHRGWSAAV